MISDPEKTEKVYGASENQKKYQALLQNQLLNIENPTLLNELHRSDENFMNKNQYV